MKHQVAILLIALLIPTMLMSQRRASSRNDSNNETSLSAEVVYNNRIEQVSLKRLVDGDVSLYSLRNNIFFIRVPENDRFIHLPFHQELRYVDDGYTRKSRQISTTHHIDTLLHYLPAERFENQIRSLRIPTTKNLTGLIDEYNRYLTNDLPDIISGKLGFEIEHERPELIVDGRLQLYHSGKGDNQRFFVRMEGNNRVIELPYFKSSDTSLDGFAIRSYLSYDKSYQDTLRMLMSDAPEVAKEIDGLGLPTVRSLSRIITKYNQEFEPEEGFRWRNLKNIRFSVSPGFQFYNDIYHPIQEDSIAFFTGFMLDAGYNLGNMDVRLAIGSLFPQLGFLNRYYKYPLRLTMRYDFGRVLPFVALSSIKNNSETFSYKTYSITLGADIKLARNFYLTILPEFERLGKDALTPIEEKTDKPIFSLWTGLKLSF